VFLVQFLKNYISTAVSYSLFTAGALELDSMLQHLRN